MAPADRNTIGQIQKQTRGERKIRNPGMRKGRAPKYEKMRR